MDETAIECPFCMEKLDSDDQSFFPCPCGYQMCRFCFKRLEEEDDDEEGNRCPACRKVYKESDFIYKQVTQLTSASLETQKKRKGGRTVVSKQKQKSNKEFILELQEKRIIQTNLVFIIGLSQLNNVASLKADMIRFGKVTKFITNANTAYITYVQQRSAIEAIKAVRLKYKQLKASLGTTKYCVNWLKKKQCQRRDQCMYLHYEADSEACFTKEQMKAGLHNIYEKKLIEGGGGENVVNKDKTKKEEQINHCESETEKIVKPEVHVDEEKVVVVVEEEEEEEEEDEENVQEEEEDDDGLDFDPITISTTGLQDLLNNTLHDSMPCDSSSASSTTSSLSSNNSSSSSSSPLSSDFFTLQPQRLPTDTRSSTGQNQQWQDSLRALFPTVNITFASSPRSKVQFRSNTNHSRTPAVTNFVNGSPPLTSWSQTYQYFTGCGDQQFDSNSQQQRSPPPGF